MYYKIIHLKEVDSTNNFAKKLEKKAKQPNFCCISSSKQVAGKGLAQNKWETQPDKNLTFSIILHPQSISAAEQFYISKFISVQIIYFFNKMKTGFKIKWPNDIYFENNKIGGILIENTLAGANISSCIIGIGLNINQVDFSQTLPNPISLAQILHKESDLDTILSELLHLIYSNWKLIESRDFININDAYFHHLYQYFQNAKYQDADHTFEGKIIGTEESGRLIIEKTNGEIGKYFFKEVVYKNKH